MHGVIGGAADFEPSVRVKVTRHAIQNLCISFGLTISNAVLADLEDELALVKREYEGTVNAIAWINTHQVKESKAVPVPGRLMEFVIDAEPRDHVFDDIFRPIVPDLNDEGVRRVWYYIVDGGMGAGILKAVVPSRRPQAVLPILQTHFRGNRFRDLKISMKAIEGGVSVRLLDMPETYAPVGDNWKPLFNGKLCDCSGHGYLNTRVSTLWVPEVQPQLRVDGPVIRVAVATMRDMQSISFCRSETAEWPRVILFFASRQKADDVSGTLWRSYDADLGRVDGLTISRKGTAVVVEPTNPESLAYLTKLVNFLRREPGLRLP